MLRPRSSRAVIRWTFFLLIIPYGTVYSFVNFLHIEKDGELSNPNCPACQLLQQTKTPDNPAPDISPAPPDPMPTLVPVVRELIIPEEQTQTGLQQIRAPPLP